VELPLAVYEEITGSSELPPPVDEADFERRSHRRMPFGFRATILPTRKGVEGPASVVMVRDISVAGVSILHEEALKQGTLFTIEFKGTDDRPVKIQCTSVRCEQGGTGGTQYVIGATFDEVLTKDLPHVPAEGSVEPLSDQSPIDRRVSPLETEKETVPPVPAPAAETIFEEPAPVAEPSPKQEESAEQDDILDWLNGVEEETAKLEAETAKRKADPAKSGADAAEPVAETANPKPEPVKPKVEAEKPKEKLDKQPEPALEEAAVAKAPAAETPPEPANDAGNLAARLTKSEAPPVKKTFLPEAEAAAKAPTAVSGDSEKAPGKLFRANSETEKPSKPALAASEERTAAKPTTPAKPPQAATAASATPTRTDVPEPYMPAKKATVPITHSPAEPIKPIAPLKETTMARDTDTPTENTTGGGRDVLTGVKSLLLRQKQTLETQDREIQGLQGEVTHLKRQIAHLQVKAQADDKAIAELAAFLQKEVGDTEPEQKSSVAA
jgi:hypothetical protein